MTNSEKFQNLDVVEVAPTDLDEEHQPSSRWAKTSRAVTGVAGGFALAAGLVAGASFGVVGVIEGENQVGANDPNLAYADEQPSSDTSSDASGAAFGTAPGTMPGSTLPSLPGGAAPSGTNAFQGDDHPAPPAPGAKSGDSSVTLPPLPSFGSGNTSSATPLAGGSGTSATGSYGGEHDDHEAYESHDREDHEDHEGGDD